MIVGLPGTGVNEKGELTRMSVTGASHTSLTKLAGSNSTDTLVE